MHPEEDSDEEWLRIADEVSEFEARYTAARNAATPSRNTCTAPGAAQPPTRQPQPMAHAMLATPCNATTPTTPRQTPTCHPSDCDPYALALQQRDAQLDQLRAEHAGEVANYRNKVRALQNQIQAGRLNVRAGTNGSGVTSGAVDVAQLESEKGRLKRELELMQREMVGMKERLMYAEHELGEAKDREKRRGGGGVGGGEGEVVEGTQWGGGRGLTGGGGSRYTGGRTVVKKVKRKRRVSSAGGRLEGGGGEGGLTQGDDLTQTGGKGEGGEVGGAEEKGEGEWRAGRKRGMEDSGRGERSGHGVEHGWGVRMSEGVWEYGVLRREVFGGDMGERLLEIATRLRVYGLRDGMLRAMDGDGGWWDLMEGLGGLLKGGRGAKMVGLECLWRILTFCGECRRGVGRGRSGIMESVRSCLEVGTEEKDGDVAAGCMRVMIGGGCGVGEIEKGGERVRKAICCEAGLEWIGGGNEEAEREAVGLVDIVSRLAMEEEVEGEGEGWRGVEWGFVERGYVKVCKMVREGRGGVEGVRRVVGMLMRGVIWAPYVVVECGGGEVAANLFIRGIGKGDVGMVVGCGKVVCLAVEEGGVAVGTRNVLLGVVGEGIGKGGSIAVECDRVLKAMEVWEERAGHARDADL